MFELLLMIFILYVLYKLVSTGFKIVAVVIIAIGTVVFYTVAVIGVVIAKALRGYGRLVAINPVITIGLTCAALLLLRVVSH